VIGPGQALLDQDHAGISAVRLQRRAPPPVASTLGAPAPDVVWAKTFEPGEAKPRATTNAASRKETLGNLNMARSCSLAWLARLWFERGSSYLI